jgi:flavodoxin
MKFVIVYDSVSKTRVTEKVAVMIQDALKEKGIEAEALQVNHAGAIKIEDFDCLIIGSPTMAWKPTKETMRFLDGLKGKVTSPKYAASFDTQMKLIISGNATKAMGEKLAEIGFKIAQPPLLAYVQGGKDKYRLRDGEQEKIKRWAKGVSDAVSNK